MSNWLQVFYTTNLNIFYLPFCMVVVMSLLSPSPSPYLQPQTISVVSLVSALVDEAYKAKASDIHLDPVPSGMRVRFRIDGALRDKHLLPTSLRLELIARIKILSGLRTDEHQAAQDGRFRYIAEDGVTYADIRVSIAPTYHGENAVLRILADTAQHFSLEALGFTHNDCAIIDSALKKPDGMILATGPTGSGKTTTLYALLRKLHAPDRSLVTIEDPVEYAMEGVKQIQVQPRTGLTFAHGLRAILRQDPDVIMVGEIRDAETASVAVNTALTGHILLSTLHTNGAVETIPRLFDLGIEPYLIASTLRVVLAQRLVRRVCEGCKAPEDLPQALQNRVDKILGCQNDAPAAWSRGTGCLACEGTGYLGRLSICEILSITDEITDAILSPNAAQEIGKIVRKTGMRTMREDGLRKARDGETTVEEIFRILHA
jgi:type II secretory ATPase GspE/PulE/Tfp pilus assembly ATPase PilB-like protein